MEPSNSLEETARQRQFVEAERFLGGFFLAVVSKRSSRVPLTCHSDSLWEQFFKKIRKGKSVRQRGAERLMPLLIMSAQSRPLLPEIYQSDFVKPSWTMCCCVSCRMQPQGQATSERHASNNESRPSSSPFSLISSSQLQFPSCSPSFVSPYLSYECALCVAWARHAFSQSPSIKPGYSKSEFWHSLCLKKRMRTR